MQHLFFSPHICDSGCNKTCSEGRQEEGRRERVHRARLVCESCPVRQQCLDYANDNNIIFGIWGGKTERERQRMRRVIRDTRSGT